MKQTQAHIVLFMVSVALVFGAAVAGIHLLSKDTIARNDDIHFQRALVDVFRLATAASLETISAAELAALVDARVNDDEMIEDPESGWRTPLFKAYADPQRRELSAYGFRFRGLGFWAPIEGILAVTPDLQQSVGIVILAQEETPGLGGRIEEAVFRDQFTAGVVIAPPPAGESFITISASKPAGDSPGHRRHVDAITGATQTSMAMGVMLNDHLSRFQRAMAHRNASNGEGLN